MPAARYITVTPEQIQGWLAQPVQARFGAANATAVHPELLTALTQDPEQVVRSAARRNRKLPEATRRALVEAAATDLTLRLEIAPNPALDDEDLHALVASWLTTTDADLAAAPHLSGAPLDDVIRWRIAPLLNRATIATPTLALVARAPYPKLRALVAKHRATPHEVVAELLTDPVLKVREAAALAPNATREMLEARVDVERSLTVLRMIAHRLPVGSPALERALARLAEHSTAYSSRMLVARRASDPDLVTKACLDRDEWIRRSAAGNAACPEEGKVLVALQPTHSR